MLIYTCYLWKVYFRGVNDNVKSKIILKSSDTLCAVVEKSG